MILFGSCWNRCRGHLCLWVRWLPLWLTGILATVPANTFAQSPGLQQLWQTALRNNPAYLSARAEAEKAEHEVSYQKREWLPKLNGQASYSYVSEVPQLELPFKLAGVSAVQITAGTYRRYDLSASLQQPIFTGGRLRNQVKLAEHGAAASRAQLQAKRNALLLQVGVLYYEVLQSNLQEKVLDAGIARAELHLRRARSLMQAAQATAFDTLEVANRRLSLINRKNQLRNSRKILLARLQRLLKTDTLPTISSRDSLQLMGKLESLRTYLDLAERQRPELKAVREGRSMQQAKLRVVRAAYFPQVFGQFSYHYARPGVNFFRDEWMTYYTAGVGLQWNLWSWGQRRIRAQEVELDLRRASLDEQDLRAQIRQQVQEAYYRLQTLADQIRLQDRLVAQERERYRLTQERYQQGQATSMDLSDAEKSLLTAELTQKQFRTQWQMAWLQLDFATGIIGRGISESR